MTDRDLVLGAQEEMRRKRAGIAWRSLARYDMMSQTAPVVEPSGSGSHRGAPQGDRTWSLPSRLAC
jgi:hypothetical protein